MSYKNYKWEVVAHDYNSPFLRNWLWTHSFFKYPKLLNTSRVVLGIASKNNQIEYLADVSTWIKAHEELKTKILKDFNNFEELIDKSIKWGEEMNNWTEKNIFKRDLTKLSNKKLVELFKKFIDMQEDEYAYGTALPVLDFMNFSFVESNLNRILKENFQKNDFQKYYSIFTEPEKNSFSQDQEEALLKIASKYWSSKKWKNDIRNKAFQENIKRYPKFHADLKKHTNKYAWTYYVYMGPAFTERDFYSFIVNYVENGTDPQKKLIQLKEKRSKILTAKKEALKKLKLNDLDKFILKISSKVVWAKPRRKDYQSRSYYHAEKLCREISKRLFIALEQVRSMPINLIEKALAGEKMNLSMINNIKKFHICLPNDNGSISILTGKEAENFSKKKIKRKNEKHNFSKIKELKGTIACPGKATGIAKIINVPEDMDKMENGDILVSSATTPSIVPAMKKASAIVTDEGGLTCHASIVSRELNTPCVVGLKFVTKFIQDGDKVEVDANKAIIKKIK